MYPCSISSGIAQWQCNRRMHLPLCVVRVSADRHCGTECVLCAPGCCPLSSATISPQRLCLSQPYGDRYLPPIQHPRTCINCMQMPVTHARTHTHTVLSCRIRAPSYKPQISAHTSCGAGSVRYPVRVCVESELRVCKNCNVDGMFRVAL